MANSLFAIISEIKQDVSRIANKIAKGVAEVAYTDMQEAHRAIMNSFYAGYSPVKSYTYFYFSPDGKGFYYGRSHGYRRTHNLRKSLSPVGVVGGGHSYSAIIDVGSDGMADYTNSTGHTFPGSAVFDLIWNQGIRGLPPGWRGHIGNVDIDAAPVGVGISGIPDEAMGQFLEKWWDVRGSGIADSIAFSV